MIPLKDLRKIVRFCQKNGIFRFRSGDFEIEIAKYQPSPSPSTNQAISDEKAESFPSWDTLTPEQKLLWSATPDANFNG